MRHRIHETGRLARVRAEALVLRNTNLPRNEGRTRRYPAIAAASAECYILLKADCEWVVRRGVRSAEATFDMVGG